MVITQGLFNNMRSMITGWYKEKVARAIKPPRAAAEPRPDIAKALKNEGPLSPVETQAPSPAKPIDPLTTQPEPAAKTEGPIAAPPTADEETKKDVEAKS
jgi:hypothetical protein